MTENSTDTASETPETEGATETKMLFVTWESAHLLVVPAGTELPPTLDGLMDLVRADAENTGGDLTSGAAEPRDWQW